MGLAIHSQSPKEYRSTYQGLHTIRYLTYKILNGQKSLAEYLTIRESQCDWAYFNAFYLYPQINQHSDCEGEYTLKGRLNLRGRDWLTGNSRKLLAELEKVNTYRTQFANEDWTRFDMLYDLVKDVVENYDGALHFC